MRIPVLLLWLAISSVSPAHSQSSSVAAIVKTVDGKAWVRDTKAAKPILLRKGDKLFPVQWVSCGRGCKLLTISQCNLEVPVTAAPPWTQILGINCFPRKGTRAGRDKGESGSILSPRDSEHIRPGDFSLTWQPFDSSREVELSVQIYLGERIWGPEKVDGRKGSFDSAKLRNALKAAQADDHLILMVVLEDRKNPKQRVKFYLISREDHQKLQRDLSRFTTAPSNFLVPVARASAFGEYELYTQAARELERALKIAQQQKPDGITTQELKTLIVQAHYMAYDDARVRELCKSWRSGSEMPFACSKIH